jgi:hypothetical protein
MTTGSVLRQRTQLWSPVPYVAVFFRFVAEFASRGRSNLKGLRR